MKVRFSIEAINRMQCPPDKKYIRVHDALTPKLIIRVTPASKTFYLYRKFNGKPKEHLIGRYPDISIDQARTRAAELNGKMAIGESPAPPKRKSITVQEMFDNYMEFSKGRSTAKTLSTDHSRFDTCLQSIKYKSIASLQFADIERLHSTLGSKGKHVTANRAIQFLRRMLNWAKVEPNPCKGIRFYRENTRERFLSADEVASLFAAVKKEKSNPMISDFILMCLWTAARRSNVQAMAWVDIDMSKKTWTVPASQSKNKKSMIIHLPDQAIEILNRRQAAYEKAKKRNRETSTKTYGGVYVFPSYGKTHHLVEPAATWKRIIARSKIKDFHVHDLRRTLASWMASGGTSLKIIQDHLGHADPRTTQIYARLTRTSIVDAVNKAASELAKAGE